LFGYLIGKRGQGLKGKGKAPRSAKKTSQLRGRKENRVLNCKDRDQKHLLMRKYKNHKRNTRREGGRPGLGGGRGN